jgi:tetratricopeptide (TPR) repeat protein
MKTIILFFLLPVLIFGIHQNIYGQEDKDCQKAKESFDRGHYKDAVKEYNAIKDNVSKRFQCTDMKKNLEKAERCMELKNEADNLFKNKYWEKAKEKYVEIIALNGNDQLVNSRITICDQHIENISNSIEEFLKAHFKHLDSTYLMALNSLIKTMNDSNETAKDSNEKLMSIIEVLNKMKNDENNTIDSKEIEKIIALFPNPTPPPKSSLGQNLIPFGIPQFCKGDKRRGTTFLIGEASLCIAGALSYYSVADGHYNDAKKTNDPQQRKAYMDKMRNWETASYTCFCIAGGFYIWQICQGLYADNKQKQKMILTPYVTPQSSGMALLYKF